MARERQLEMLTRVRRAVADLAGSRKRLELQADQLAGLQRQYAGVRAGDERVTVAGQRLQAEVDAFRTREEAVKAACAAARVLPRTTR